MTREDLITLFTFYSGASRYDNILRWQIEDVHLVFTVRKHLEKNPIFPSVDNNELHDCFCVATDGGNRWIKEKPKLMKQVKRIICMKTETA